mmetsp:Transcript_30679/g.73704  ORF Transcript_30679/g.73704 Transcript_30679/m.73704 type:complete len:204 (-) Transcript_30679:306-917(-)
MFITKMEGVRLDRPNEPGLNGTLSPTDFASLSFICRFSSSSLNRSVSYGSAIDCGKFDSVPLPPPLVPHPQYPGPPFLAGFEGLKAARSYLSLYLSASTSAFVFFLSKPVGIYWWYGEMVPPQSLGWPEIAFAPPHIPAPPLFGGFAGLNGVSLTKGGSFFLYSFSAIRAASYGSGTYAYSPATPFQALRSPAVLGTPIVVPT